MPRLFDREAELGRLRGLLDDVRTGTGRLAVVTGAPGVGKTALLEEFLAIASNSGFRELHARCGEFEQDFTLGVVRQLVEPVVSKLGDAERERVLAGPAARAAATLEQPASTESVAELDLFHGLYWLCANLSSEAPLVIAVDDAQWGDAASLQWLRYLARRIDQLPVLIVLTTAT